MTTTERAPTRWTKRSLAAGLTVIVAAMAVIAGALVFGAVPASATKDVRVTICHATSSHQNPYVEITVRGSSIDEVQNELFNGHGDHVGPVYDPEAVPAMEDWGDIIPAYGTFPGINPAAQVEGCTIGIHEEFDAAQAYCAVDPEALSGYVLDELAVAGYPTQKLADKALVDLAESTSTGIIPEFTAGEFTFDGLNWDSNGQALFADGCVTTPGPTLYAGTAEYPKVNVCLGPDLIQVGPIAPTYSTERVYSSEAEANAAAGAYVSGSITGKTVEFMAAHPEYAPVPASGLCSPAEIPLVVSPVEPEAVVVEPGVVQPGVVAAPKPAKVVKPARVDAGLAGTPEAATVPTAVPAGDGSSVPQTPAWALALLALGTVGLLASGTRLVAARSR